ncbi:heavy-metal-associated domain-containing protein [Castellaniella sp. GW247-6E4]|uniref:heavy-metal-associated domain-containing protein n=1 Tax=Castellaniella sp. GW247-6E4 TaxID=3140380 RepID=UPI0033152C99
MKAEFIVSDMTCNHCVQTITRAVQAHSPGAEVRADLGTHRVTVEAAGDAAAVEAVIREAGYEVRAA